MNDIKNNFIILLEVSLAARTMYGFLKSYFTSPSSSSPPPSPSPPPSSLSSLSINNANAVNNGKPIRIYMDGCFDLIHFGHANAIRQASTLGSELIVGVCSDEEIVKYKGVSPVLSNEERYQVIESMKWVTSVIKNAPYNLNMDFIQKLLNEHQIDYIVHGDDPCYDVNGNDAYEHVKKLGKFKVIKRTEGISSTNIVDQILYNQYSNNENTDSFLTTSRRILQFSNPYTNLNTKKIIYVVSDFDLFHVGYIQLFQFIQHKNLGDFILCGILNNQSNSIMNVYEKSLMMLSCKHVNEVIIDAPRVITKDLITSMNISVVIKHSQLFKNHDVQIEKQVEQDSSVSVVDISDEFEMDLTSEQIQKRIQNDKIQFIKRNQKKKLSQVDYVSNHKQFIEER